jgi:2-polyprenyl-3-methyl-5-hydroxy-6-metoxy-1,4-benzoquinol methylase
MESTKHPTLELQESYWDNRWTRTPKANAYQLRRGEAVLKIVKGLNLKNPKIIDLGCGTGWFTQALTNCGEALGIDLSEEAIKTAQDNFPGVKYRAGNVYEMDLPKGCFDIVVSQEVIAHVQNQVEYLKLTMELLKPGGYLIITTVNKFVHQRMNWPQSETNHIEDWLDRKGFKKLLIREYNILKITTALPMGDRGIFRLINSTKLNKVINVFFEEESIALLKERLGCGWTLLALCQKRK